jgi:hypothetical protein
MTSRQRKQQRPQRPGNDPESHGLQRAQAQEGRQAGGASHLRMASDCTRAMLGWQQAWRRLVSSDMTLLELTGGGARCARSTCCCCSCCWR